MPEKLSALGGVVLIFNWQVDVGGLSLWVDLRVEVGAGHVDEAELRPRR